MFKSLGENIKGEELVQVVDAVEAIGQELYEVKKQLVGTYLSNYKEFFQAIINVVQNYKGTTTKESGIYWVVEILESISWKILDIKKGELKKQIEQEKLLVQPQPERQQFTSSGLDNNQPMSTNAFMSGQPSAPESPFVEQQ